jgi:hypothetical protein
VRSSVGSLRGMQGGPNQAPDCVKTHQNLRGRRIRQRLFRWKFSICATAMPRPYVLWGVPVSSLPSLPEGNQQAWYAKDVEHSREVVCQARAADFRANVLKPLHEEIPLSIGVFDRAKGVFHARLALRHDLRGGFASFLPPLAAVLSAPMGNPATILVAGARILQRTSLACGGGGGAKMAAQLGRLTSPGQLRSPRAPVAVLLRVLAEALLAPEAPRGVG